MSTIGRDARWFVPAAITVYAVSLLPASATPILMSALIEHLRFSGPQAGFIATSSLFALALGTMLVVGVLGRITNRMLVTCSAILVLAASVVSTLPKAFSYLATIQVLAGLGWGVLYGTANATLASADDPDRLFAKAILVVKISAALMLFTLPSMVKLFKQSGVFYFFAAAVLVALPLMARIPDHVKTLGARSSATEPLQSRGKALIGSALMLVTLLFFVVNGAAWAMAAQIGQSAGLPLDKIGFILGAVITAGTLGPLAAAWLGTRYGRLPPLLIGISLNALAILGLTCALAPPIYIGCLVVFDISFLFIHPYLLGAASELDKAGRWVTASSSAGMIGFGLAPAIAGFLAERFGMTSVGLLSVIAGLPMMVMILRINAYLQKWSR